MFSETAKTELELAVITCMRRRRLVIIIIITEAHIKAAENDLTSLDYILIAEYVHRYVTQRQFKRPRMQRLIKFYELNICRLSLWNSVCVTKVYSQDHNLLIIMLTLICAINYII